MVFEGGILSSMRKIWGDPYSNSTTILFDFHVKFYAGLLAVTFSEIDGCMWSVNGQ